jgi:hypothetical protein
MYEAYGGSQRVMRRVSWLVMGQLTREQFVQKLIEHVRSRFPLVKVARADQSFAVTINGHVASLENLYRAAALRPEDLARQVERWTVELLRAAEGSPDQFATFEELRPRIYPMILPAHAADMDTSAMVVQPFVGKLLIAYAVDSDRTITYITRSHFESWKLSIDELHETAIGNLVGRSEAMNAHAAQDEKGRINLILFRTLDGYDASRLLLPSLHERLREHLGSPFVAGIPNRDILLCFRNDDSTVNGLRRQIIDDYHHMPHHVTDQLFLVTPDGIAQRL